MAEITLITCQYWSNLSKKKKRPILAKWRRCQQWFRIFNRGLRIFVGFILTLQHWVTILHQCWFCAYCNGFPAFKNFSKIFSLTIVWSGMKVLGINRFNAYITFLSRRNQKELTNDLNWNMKKKMQHWVKFWPWLVTLHYLMPVAVTCNSLRYNCFSKNSR